MTRAAAFAAFAARKTRAAERAAIHRLVTIEDRSSRCPLTAIGSQWSRHFYDGPFHLIPVPPGTSPSPDPTISLVFVQSKDGNTGIDDPGELGGGDTDKHLIYEGLSRVAADAVLSGASSAAGDEVFFSVWHPELVALRASLALPRHPTQVLLTRRGRIDPHGSLIFNVPEARTIVLARPAACESLAPAVASRPWVHLVAIDGDDVSAALRQLRTEFGIQRISCIGGRTTASALLDAGLVDDLLLTTTERTGGEPDTPFYAGRTPPVFDTIVRKQGTDPQAPFVFEHLRVRRGRA